MENSKELFVKAFMDAEQIDNSSLKSEDEIEWDFSKKFEKSMDKLIRKNKRIKLSTRRNIRKGLLAAIIVIIVTFTGLMTVSATRIPFIEFIKKVFPQYNQIVLSKESTPPVDRIEKEYTLTNLPEGYNLETYQKDDLGVFAVWKNNQNEEITFFQNVLDVDLSVDNEHNYKEIDLNGYEAYISEYELETSLKWTDGNYCFLLKVPNDINDEIVDIAKNISEKN